MESPVMPEIHLLGPLEVTGTHGTVSWPGARRRSLFALLALRPNQLVSSSSLIDGLWGDRPPATARKTLHGHVAQARKALSAAGLAGLLETRTPGYLLQVDRAAVDVHRFDEYARAGRDALERGECRQAIDRFEAGLALWHGDPLADCPAAGWADAELIRLHEARALAEEHLVTGGCGRCSSRSVASSRATGCAAWRPLSSPANRTWARPRDFHGRAGVTWAQNLPEITGVSNSRVTLLALLKRVMRAYSSSVPSGS
jgi:hypothetical protein